MKVIQINMNQQEFKNYQKELARRREEFLAKNQKLSPKVILSDDMFDASIEDIPLAISLPPQEMKKPVVHNTTQPKSIRLF